MILIVFIIYLSQGAFNKRVDLSSLRSGMVLKHDIVKKGKRYVLMFRDPISADRKLGSDRNLIEHRPEGINKSDIAKILKAKRDGLIDFTSIEYIN